MPANRLRVNIVQNAAGPDPGVNLAGLRRMIRRGPPADLIMLPEIFAARTTPAGQRARAESIPGPLCDWAAGMAREHRAWLLAGSLVEKSGARRHNTSVLFDRRGRIRARYRKIHLFSATLEDGRTVREQAIYDAGRQPVLAEIDGWLCGLSICYDLRFPELFRRYAAAGARILFVPANFTRGTGRDHWTALLRARAIENQAFVLAPNQCGINRGDGVAAYGNSMAVDPWGRVMARAGGRPALLSVMLDRDRLTEIRRRLPALEHRRRIGPARPSPAVAFSPGNRGPATRTRSP